MLLHPRLLRLLEAGRDARESGDLSSLSDLLTDARAFVLEQDGIFEGLAIAIPLRGAAGEKVRDVRLLFAQARACLDGVEQASADQNLARLGHELVRFEETMGELVPALGALDEVERTLERASPLPMIDRIIRIAGNVREGYLDPSLLRQHFGAVVNTVRTLAGNLERFRALHTAPPELLESWEREFGNLEAGCGAMMEHFETGSDDALIDSLKFFRASSAALIELLAKMDEIARAEARHARILALDEVLLAAEGVREGRVSPDILVLASGGLQTLGGFYASALDTVAAFPLAFMVRAEWDALRAAMEALQAVAFPWLRRVSEDPRGAAGQAAELASLAERFKAAAEAHQRLQDAVAAHVEALKGASNVQEVVDALGRLPARGVAVSYAVDRVRHFLEVHNDLIAQIDETGNPDLAEMRLLVLEQAAAVEEMARYVDDSDEGHLCNGFMRLCAIHPRVMEMQAAMRSAADAQRRARERTITCFRCGAANAATHRHCTGCNAMLPMVQADETVYAEVGAAEPSGTPENLRRLERLAERFANGDAPQTLLAELDGLHAQLETLSREFDGGVGGRAARSDDRLLADFAEALRAQFDRLLFAVRAMRGAIEGGDGEALQAALQAALAAGRDMQITQQELQSGMGVPTTAP